VLIERFAPSTPDKAGRRESLEWPERFELVDAYRGEIYGYVGTPTTWPLGRF
jgi:hypothetical protein